mmetsp:Transcript_11540/g.25639  ORF Transcript_11540/g.25639 Transcript_11540/m.25639 type:complete len:182 (-) Transcript_11540:119-664(-)
MSVRSGHSARSGRSVRSTGTARSGLGGTRPLSQAGRSVARSEGSNRSASLPGAGTPSVRSVGSYDPIDWEREYKGRYMRHTTYGEMGNHIEQVYDQAAQTHAEKLSWFNKHEYPTMPWIQTHYLTDSRSSMRQQPCYWGSDRPVMTKRKDHGPTFKVSTNPRLSMFSKTQQVLTRPPVPVS